MLERINNRRRAAGEGGFTLIELLVVIVILAILAAVVVFAVGGIGDRGQGAACTIDTRTLRTAGEAFFAQNNSYGADPANWDGITPAPTGVGQPGGARTTIDENTYVTGGFLSEISDYHNIAVYDSNADGAHAPPSPANTETHALEVIVADSRCGTVGQAVNGTTNL